MFFIHYLFRLIRPVGNSSDRLTVKMGLKLSQIIGVDMKRQIMITNVWVEQVNKLGHFNITKTVHVFYKNNLACVRQIMIPNVWVEQVNKRNHFFAMESII